MSATALKRNLKNPKQKVNKKAKPGEIEAKEVSSEEYRCTCCGHKYRKQETNFSKSKSPLFAGNNGYLSICRNCIAQLYEQYIKFYDNDEEAAAERICQITDMYFDPNIFAMSRKISDSRNGYSRNRISTYVSKLNLNPDKECTTYSDTLIRRWESDVANAESVKDAVDNSDTVTSKEVIRRFGVGFTDGEYDSLQYEYQDWVDRYGEPIDKRQEELYVSICYLKLNLQKGTQSGSQSAGSLANSYKSAIEAATVEIEDRLNKQRAASEMRPIGVLIRDMEQFCPAEYYKDKKLYSDYDSLKAYIMRFMVRPLRNLVAGSKDMDKEFHISNSEEEA